MLYGPPPDPRQVSLDLGPLDAPMAWAACLALAALLVLMGTRIHRLPRDLRAFLVMLGIALGLTAPLAGVLDAVVYGAWPTIDKAGSFLFYGEGVHRSLWTDPLGDPALRLIGAHVGHFWLVAFFDTCFFLSPHGAFNALALLLPVLAWFCAWKLFVELGASPRAALLLAFPFAMGLHVFRDLNWATVEKAAVFGVPIYLFTLLRAWRRGGAWIWICGATFAGAAFVNLYLGLLNAPCAALFLLAKRDRRALAAVGASALFALPLVTLQATLLHGAGELAEPERFLRERAALDILSLWPPRWVRLEVWRALNLPAVSLGVWAGIRRFRESDARWALAGILLFFVISLGPCLSGLPDEGVPNPVYMAAWRLLPGFWRLAKPEFLFEASYLGLLALAALEAGRWLRPGTRAGRWGPPLILAVLLLAWILSVRGHPAFPGFSAPVDVSLSPRWAERVFEPSGTP
jgi:hypothetical protein